MERIRASDIRRFAPVNEATSVATAHAPVASGAPAQFLVGKHGLDIAALLGDLSVPSTKVLLSEGDWSLHEVIKYLFSVTGPASFALTSWGLTEKPLQQVLNLVEHGNALQPVILLDYRVKLQSAAAYQLLLASGLDIRLTQNHSKMAVLLNEHFGITVLTSANLTRNPRLEFYVVSTDRAMAVACRKMLMEIHSRSQPLT